MKNIRQYLSKGRVFAGAMVVAGLAGVEHYATGANAIASTLASAAVSAGVQSIAMHGLRTKRELSERNSAMDFIRQESKRTYVAAANDEPAQEESAFSLRKDMANIYSAASGCWQMKEGVRH